MMGHVPLYQLLLDKMDWTMSELWPIRWLLFLLKEISKQNDCLFHLVGVLIGKLL